MDTCLRVPGTNWRFGLDSLIGLIPGVGDAVGAFVSLYIVALAWRMGVRSPTIARMLANIAVDSAIGAIPLAGDIFDVVWKANARNLRLAERDLSASIRRPDEDHEHDRVR